jgi:hypothetical protein
LSVITVSRFRLAVILETVTTIEHRCEALTISDLPPCRCATADRRGRAVCASHARTLRIHRFDDAADE